VRVRFTPTTSTTASATVSFTANGDTISGIVTGTGTGSAADTIAPSIAITSPSATVTGTVTVSASASDNVGVAGVQFKVDGANLGVEVTTSPYATTWSSATFGDGAHVVTAVARDAAGNKTSAGITVTVANGARDTTGPVISKPTVSATSTTSVTISWTTNEPGDTQVEYGQSTSYGSLTTLDGSLVTSHLQVITGLARHTWYHFRIRSRDAARNLTLSTDFKFRTR
jgi:hypothetical protein